VDLALEVAGGNTMKLKADFLFGVDVVVITFIEYKVLRKDTVALQ
jgi:hypothetical protein